MKPEEKAALERLRRFESGEDPQSIYGGEPHHFNDEAGERIGTFLSSEATCGIYDDTETAKQLALREHPADDDKPLTPAQQAALDRLRLIKAGRSPQEVYGRAGFQDLLNDDTAKAVELALAAYPAGDDRAWDYED